MASSLLMKFRFLMHRSQISLLELIMPSEEIVDRINDRNRKAVDIVNFLKNEIPQLRKVLIDNHILIESLRIKDENQQLKKELEVWKNKLIEIEARNGVQQIHLPSEQDVMVCKSADANSYSENKESEVHLKLSDKNEPPASNPPCSVKEADDPKAINKKEKPAKPAKTSKGPAKDEGREVDISRLDLRIGRILSVNRHPDADALYVEQVDVGEEKPRTVVSGLVKFVPIEQMQNRMVVVLCNLKPVKMRGIVSEAMVMCASTSEKVEVLDPPGDSVPGDRAVCDSYPGEPDALLNPKKKIFELVAPDLKTNYSCIATYKGSPLQVLNKGVIKSASLCDVNIK